MDTVSRPPLPRGHWIALVLWLLLAMVSTVTAVISSQGTTGWEGLLTFLAILFFVFAVAAIVIIWAVTRYLFSEATTRWVVLVAGPPAIFVVLVFLLRLAS